MPAWEWEAGWWVCAMPHMIKCRCFVVHAYTLPSDQKSMSTRYGLMDLDMPPTRTGFPPTATALSFMCYVRIDISIIVDFKNFAGPFGAVSAFASAALFWYNTQLRVQRVGTGTPGQRELHKFQVHNSPRFCKRFSNLKRGTRKSKRVHRGGNDDQWKIQGSLV